MRHFALRCAERLVPLRDEAWGAHRRTAAVPQIRPRAGRPTGLFESTSAWVSSRPTSTATADLDRGKWSSLDVTGGTARGPEE